MVSLENHPPATMTNQNLIFDELHDFSNRQQRGEYALIERTSASKEAIKSFDKCRWSETVAIERRPVSLIIIVPVWPEDSMVAALIRSGRIFFIPVAIWIAWFQCRQKRGAVLKITRGLRCFLGRNLSPLWGSWLYEAKRKPTSTNRDAFEKILQIEWRFRSFQRAYKSNTKS